MPTQIPGYYEKGQVVLLEKPPFTEKTEVIVTFVESKSNDKSQPRKLGTLKGMGTVPDDFDEPLDDLKEYM